LRNVWFGHFFDAERMTSPGSKAGDVEEIDARTASDDVLGRFYAVELACHHEVHPGEPVRSRDEAIAYHRYQPTTHTSCHWLAAGGLPRSTYTAREPPSCTCSSSRAVGGRASEASCLARR
jgi:hypothetical protein